MVLLRIINSSFKTKSKFIIGVRSTLRYIQLLFVSKMIQAVFGTSSSVLYQMTTCTIHVLSMRFKRQGSIAFMNCYHKSNDGYGEQYKNYKNFMTLCLHKQDFCLDAEWIFFPTSHGKSSCDRIGGSVKCHAAKRSFQKPMNYQILDYQAMPNVWEEEMRKIKFFGISKETMNEVHKSLEDWFSRGNTVPGTRSSHHFIPLSSFKVAHKLSSEDEFHAGTHDVNLSTTFELCDIRPITYVTCLFDSFWWVGLVTQVDVEQGDVKVQFMFLYGSGRTFDWPENEDHAMCQSKTFFVRYLLLRQQLDELIR